MPMSYQERANAGRDPVFVDRVAQALAEYSVSLIYLPSDDPRAQVPTYQASKAFARQVLDGLNSHAQRFAVWVLAHESQAELTKTDELLDPQLLEAIKTVWEEYGQIPATSPVVQE